MLPDNGRTSLVKRVSLFRHTHDHRPPLGHPDRVDCGDSREASVLSERDLSPRALVLGRILVVVVLNQGGLLEKERRTPGATNLTSFLGRVTRSREDKRGEAELGCSELGPVGKELLEPRARVDEVKCEGDNEAVYDEIDRKRKRPSSGGRKINDCCLGFAEDLLLTPVQGEDPDGVAEEVDAAPDREEDGTSVKDGRNGNLLRLRSRITLQNLSITDLIPSQR